MFVIVRRQAAPTTNSGKESGGLSSSILIPVIVIVACVVLIAIGTWARRRAQREYLPRPETTTATATPVTGVQNATQRRARRNRRRASQISTKSLPAYMEDPGDEEVVLVSRQRDPMPTVAESGMRPSMDSEETMPEEHIGTPLLERDPHSMPFSNAVPSEHTRSPSSAASEHSPDSDQPALSRPSNMMISEARDEAPPYFEAVGDNHDHSGGTVTHSTLSNSATLVSPPSVDSSRRHSLFRTLFPRSNEQTPPTGQNSSNESRHKPNTSLSSLRPLSLYRSRSNESTEVDQSSIPLRNISAPLAHTLVRTEFTFPKSGPTEQQIKFLSSRESLGRFGLPFGDEARAGPPSFQTVVGASSSVLSLHHSTPSLHTTNTEGHERRPSSASSTVGGNAEEQDIASPTAALPPTLLTADVPYPGAVPQPLDGIQARLPNIVTSQPTPPATSPPSPAAAPIDHSSPVRDVDAVVVVAATA